MLTGLARGGKTGAQRRGRWPLFAGRLGSALHGWKFYESKNKSKYLSGKCVELKFDERRLVLRIDKVELAYEYSVTFAGKIYF